MIGAEAYTITPTELPELPHSVVLLRKDSRSCNSRQTLLKCRLVADYLMKMDEIQKRIIGEALIEAI